MTTIVLEVKTEEAYKLIKNLEALNVVKIIEGSRPVENQRLSQKFGGSLKLTDAQYQDLMDQLSQMRAEWEKDI